MIAAIKKNRDSLTRRSSVPYEFGLVVLLFLTWGTVFLDRMSLLYLAPFIAPDLRLSHTQVGLLVSGLAIAWALSGLMLGAISDRIGRRPVLVPAVFAFSVLSCVFSLPPRDLQQPQVEGARAGLPTARFETDMDAKNNAAPPPPRFARTISRARSLEMAETADMLRPGRKRRKIGICVARLFSVATMATFFYYSHRSRPLTEKDTLVLADFVNGTSDAVFDDKL